MKLKIPFANRSPKQFFRACFVSTFEKKKKLLVTIFENTEILMFA